MCGRTPRCRARAMCGVPCAAITRQSSSQPALKRYIPLAAAVYTATAFLPEAGACPWHFCTMNAGLHWKSLTHHICAAGHDALLQLHELQSPVARLCVGEIMCRRGDCEQPHVRGCKSGGHVACSVKCSGFIGVFAVVVAVGQEPCNGRSGLQAHCAAVSTMPLARVTQASRCLNKASSQDAARLAARALAAPTARGAASLLRNHCAGAPGGSVAQRLGPPHGVAIRWSWAAPCHRAPAGRCYRCRLAWPPANSKTPDAVVMGA